MYLLFLICFEQAIVYLWSWTIIIKFIKHLGFPDQLSSNSGILVLIGQKITQDLQQQQQPEAVQVPAAIPNICLEVVSQM